MLGLTRKLVLVSVPALCAGTLALAAAAPASAQPAGAWWLTDSGASPSSLQPGKEGRIWITAIDQGWKPMEASSAHPIVVKDTLSAEVELVGTAHLFLTSTGGARSTKPVNCDATGSTIECTLAENTIFASQGIEVVIPLKPFASLASGESISNTVEISGGTIPGTTDEVPSPKPLERKIAISSSPTAFGVERYELVPENDEGGQETQAGAHPFQLTTTLDLRDTQVADDVATPPLIEESTPAPVRNLHFTLPPGLVGDVNSLKQCTAVQFNTIYNGDSNGCPASTAVGVANIKLYEPQHFVTKVETVPVFNLVPAPGEPARFGIEFAKVTVPLTTRVKTGSSYAVEVSAEETSTSAAVIDSQVTFWGVPGDPRHNSSRGWECLANGRYEFAIEHPHPCPKEAEHPDSAFLSLPTLCTTPETSVIAEPWSYTLHGSEEAKQEATYTLPALTGCEALTEQFSPALSVEPETKAASTASGLVVGISVPQSGTETAGELAEAAVSATTLALSAGLEANPGAANGLSACGIGEIGLLPGFPEVSQLENDHFTPNEATCAPGSKIGTVKIETPLLPEPLEGGLYLAHQDTNLVEEKLVGYIVAKNAVSGVLVKLAGEVHVDQNTGQLTSTFRGTPPVPFSKLTVSLFGGGQASQSTPPFCGTYTPTASFVPSSGGSKSVSATFEINSGPGGSACPGATRPLAPSFTAGSTNKQAAGFTGFTLSIVNPDGDQRLTGLSTTLPAGVAGLLSNVTACPEPPPGAPWQCGTDSLLGRATTSSGYGGEPFTLSGNVYLTKGYDGAPFGLLVSTDAVAGPFDLGMVYVRSRINVNPETAAVTVTTDPGPHGDIFPTRLKGLPVQLKQVNVTIDRPNFQFNGTNCDPLSVGGTLLGSEGGVATVSSPFQLTGCSALPFAPKLIASTHGHGSRVNGTNFNVTLQSAGLGQANIRKVFLTIPAELPSRLPTLQHACTLAKFNAGPQNCPPESAIGHATVHTPVLRSALSGPAYLVSHGNAGFPDVEFVLQGEGITLVLDGKTDIKNGVTYSRFETAPDAPFTSFETELPAGPKSILAAFTSASAADPYNICSRKLEMPTEITAQDGTVIRETTKIKALGCGGVASFKETRAQKLRKALKACRKKHDKKKRLACEKRAQKLYGHKSAKKKPAAKKK
jgi:hypothetical protein